MRFFWLLLVLATPFTHSYLRLKLQNWFPRYEHHWIEASASCQQELTNYLVDNRTLECAAPCACAADCILQNITGTMQSNLNSAQVLLGLAPAMLVFLGPSLAEVAALSTYKPLLAVLLALGSPAVNVSRLFRHVDICEPFTRPISRSSALWSTWLQGRRDVLQRSIHILSYVVALGAIANHVRNSVYTDLRTISGWRCGALFMPLAWGLLGVVVHAWGMIAVRCRLPREYKSTLRATIHSTAFQNVSMCEDDVVSEALFWVASFCAIIQMIFGILVLSSLVFISVFEAISVFVLYAVSAVLCQFVLSLELANMRHDL